MPEDLINIRKIVNNNEWLFDNKHMQPVKEALNQARINIFKDEVLSGLKGAENLTEDQIRILALSTDATISIRKDGKINVNGIFDCSDLGLTDLCGLRFGKVKGKFKASGNKLTNLEGFPIENRSSYSYEIYSNEGVSDSTLRQIYHIMYNKPCEYLDALFDLVGKIESHEWNKLIVGYEDKITPEALKTYSIISRYSS